MSADGTKAITFGCEFGALVRKEAVFQIRSGAMKYGVSCEVLEDRGFLSSEYMFRVVGPSAKVDAFREALKEWTEGIKADECDDD